MVAEPQIGCWWQSVAVATYGVLGLVMSTTLAYVLGMDQGLIHSGLFGYNGILVGLALATFQHPDDQSSDGWDPILVAPGEHCAPKSLGPCSVEVQCLQFSHPQLMWNLDLSKPGMTDCQRGDVWPIWASSIPSSTCVRKFDVESAAVVLYSGMSVLLFGAIGRLLVPYKVRSVHETSGFGALFGSAVGALARVRTQTTRVYATFGGWLVLSLCVAFRFGS